MEIDDLIQKAGKIKSKKLFHLVNKKLLGMETWWTIAGEIDDIKSPLVGRIDNINSLIVFTDEEKAIEFAIRNKIELPV